MFAIKGSLQVIDDRDRVLLTMLNSENKRLLLNTTAITVLTIPKSLREELLIPTEAEFFSFVYPSSVHEITSKTTTVELFQFYGGFVYFDELKQNVLHAISLNDVDGEYKGKNPTLLFSFPLYLDPRRFDSKQITFYNCTFPSILQSTGSFERFAWVNPGDLEFRNDGCFIFENTKGEAYYFNLLPKSEGQLVVDGNLEKHWRNFL